MEPFPDFDAIPDFYGDLGMDPEDFEEFVLPFFDHPGIIRVAPQLKSNPTCPLTVVLEAIHEHEPESVRDPVRLPDAIEDMVIKQVLRLPGYLHLHHEDPRTNPADPPDESATFLARRAGEIALATILEARIVTHRNGRLVTKAAYRDEIGRQDYRRVYVQLFHTLARSVSFGTLVPYNAFEELFGYTLLQLARRIDQPVRFLQLVKDMYDAFPALREMAAEDPPPGEDSELQTVAMRYIISIIYGFWCVLGLVDIQYAEDKDYIVTVRPLFGELVTFPREWLRTAPRLDVPDFDGLSPNAMHALIYEPLHAPEVISFAETVDNDTAPILVVLQEIIRCIDDNGGLKATKTGALPRAFAQAVGPRIRSPQEEYWARYAKSIQKESDIFTLEMARIVLEQAGVLRKYRGKFIIGREFRPAIEQHGVGGVYLELFRSAMLRYNWAYADGWDPFPRIQGFAGFTLRLLVRHGREPRPITFYSDAFVRAFPAMVEEARDSMDSLWDTPERLLASAYTNRTFDRFGHLMGLVHVIHRPGGDRSAPDIVESTPLLRAFVRVHV